MEVRVLSTPGPQDPIQRVDYQRFEWVGSLLKPAHDRMRDPLVARGLSTQRPASLLCRARVASPRERCHFAFARAEVALGETRPQAGVADDVATAHEDQSNPSACDLTLGAFMILA